MENKDGDWLPPAATTTPSGNSARFRGVMDLLLIIRDRWIWGLVIALPISLLFAYKELNVPKLFISSSTFIFEPPKNILNLSPVERDDFSKQVLGQHVQRLQTTEFKERVLTSLSNEEKESMLRPYRSLNAESNTNYIPPLFNLISNYDVSMGGSHVPVITIQARSLHDGVGAGIIANKVQSEYPNHIKSRRNQVDTTAVAFLREQLEEMTQEEKNVDQKRDEFKRSKNIVSIETDREFIVSAMRSIKASISESKVEKLKIQTVLLQILRASQENKNLFFIEDIASFRNVQQYRDRIVSLKHNLKKLELRYLELHPNILENLAETREFEGLLDGEVEMAIKTLEQKIVTISEREEQYQTELRKVQLESQKLDRIEIDYRVIEREREAKTALRDSMLKRINDIEILSEMDDSALRPGTPAGTPMTPVEPNPSQIIQKTIGVFFMAFFFIPIGLEFLDNRVKSPWDVEIFMGRDMLAGIPRISLVSETNRPLIVAQDLDESLVESFRGLYSRIQMNSDNIYPKSILVTSAVPSEGKSLLAANLAHSFANHGRKTLLLDFDLRRPGLHKICGLSNDRGLLTYVQELQANPSASLNMEDIPEVYPNLRLLPSGGKTRTATELLEKMAFTSLFTKLKREFDVILIDSSPVGLFPDSHALATKVDDLIFVSRYSKVGRRTAKTMLEKLDETGARILGVVLNDLPEKKSSSYYYNYGYYGYGYGYYRYKYYNKYYRDDNSDTMSSVKDTSNS